jgi:LacI family transcriptional regulator
MHLAFVGAEPLSGRIPSVYYDGFDAGYQAAEHLIERGYRKLLVYAPFRSSWMEDRTRGIAEAAADSAQPIEIMQPLPATDQDALEVDQGAIAYADALHLTAADLNGVGVIGANDIVAIGLRMAAAEKSLIPGRDYGLVGFDDSPEARRLRITSVRQPLESMGEEAARALMHSLIGDSSILQIRLRSHLIPRESSRGID